MKANGKQIWEQRAGPDLGQSVLPQEPAVPPPRGGYSWSRHFLLNAHSAKSCPSSLSVCRSGHPGRAFIMPFSTWAGVLGKQARSHSEPPAAKTRRHVNQESTCSGGPAFDISLPGSLVVFSKITPGVSWRSWPKAIFQGYKSTTRLRGPCLSQEMHPATLTWWLQVPVSAGLELAGIKQACRGPG